MLPPPARAQVLAIGVFGGLSLTVAGKPIQLPNRRARALLAYLAIEESPLVSREHISGLFWAESSQSHAASSLRQTLFELRRTLRANGCDALVSGREEIGLLRDRVEVDLTRAFDDIAAKQLSASLPTTIAGVEKILAGYEDLSPDFCGWLETQRRFVQRRLLTALEQVWRDENMERGTRRQFAEAALRLDPVHEAACREAMRIAAEAGEIGAALRLYEALFEAMDRLLDMEPSAATVELVAAIKMGAVDRPAAPKRPAPQPVLQQASPLRGVPVVAMLPLHVIGRDETAVWIAEALVEDTVRILAGLREMAVISSNSTRQLKGAEDKMAAVAGQLGADYLVSGSLRLAGTRVRVHIELCAPRDGTVLWAEVHQFSSDELFETQERIAARIANAVAPNISAAELSFSLSRPPSDLGAYHLLLRARHLTARLERRAFDTAGTLLLEATQRDPGFAGAHAALAAWYGLRFGQYWSENEADDSALLIRSARTAIQLDPHHARALALLGHHTMLTEQRHDAAAVLLDRAVAAAPNDAEVLLWASPTAAYVGREEEAIDRARRAIALSPVDPFRFRFAHFLSLAYYAAGDFSQAATWGLQAWQLNPNYTSNLGITAAALAALGRGSEAAPLVERYRAARPGFRAAQVIVSNSFREPAQRRQLAELLVKAGVPW